MKKRNVKSVENVVKDITKEAKDVVVEKELLVDSKVDKEINSEINSEKNINEKMNTDIKLLLENVQNINFHEINFENKKTFVDIISKFYSPMTFSSDLNKGYIYLVRTGKCKMFIPDGCEVFKIGKTSNIFKRLFYYMEECYGDNMDVVFFILCEKNLAKIETQIIKKFRESFDPEKENGFGNEYFSGEISSAISIIVDIVDKNNGLHDWNSDIVNGKWYDRDLFDNNIRSTLPKIIYLKENSQLRNEMRC
jgi:hypothetical protein